MPKPSFLTVLLGFSCECRPSRAGNAPIRREVLQLLFQVVLPECVMCVGIQCRIAQVGDTEAEHDEQERLYAGDHRLECFSCVRGRLRAARRSDDSEDQYGPLFSVSERAPCSEAHHTGRSHSIQTALHHRKGCEFSCCVKSRCESRVCL